MTMKSPASAGLFCVLTGVSHSGGEWDLAHRVPEHPHHRIADSLRMSSIESTFSRAVTAVVVGKHVDITGPRLSGRTSTLARVVDLFRRDKWEVLEISGRTPPALLPRLDTERALIAVDDWDHLDDETRALLVDSSATLVTSRAGGVPPLSDMHSLTIPPLDADAMRVALTRVVGFVIEPDDARSLAELTDGTIGTAIGIVNAARGDGTLTVETGRGVLNGDWLDAAAPVVDTLLEPLSDDRRQALAGIAQSERVRGLGGAAVEELVALGYLEELPEDCVRVPSTLLTRWFTRS